jgi:hypothetical protein
LKQYINYKNILDCNIAQLVHVYNIRGFRVNNNKFTYITQFLIKYAEIMQNEQINSGCKEISECNSSSEFLNEGLN